MLTCVTWPGFDETVMVVRAHTLPISAHCDPIPRRPGVGSGLGFGLGRVYLCLFVQVCLCLSSKLGLILSSKRWARLKDTDCGRRRCFAWGSLCMYHFQRVVFLDDSKTFVPLYGSLSIGGRSGKGSNRVLLCGSFVENCTHVLGTKYWELE